MKAHHYNFIWLGIIAISIIGLFIIIKTAYANPLNLPDYAFTIPKIKEAYTFAKLNGEMLNGLPCNCGCMIDEGHAGRIHSRGLIDCFMEGDVSNGGNWDAHASQCGMCFGDALEAKELYEEGKTKEEIKLYLEAKYKDKEISSRTVYENE